jgi:predicted dehydrogenase
MMEKNTDHQMTRRKFTKTAVASATGFYLVPRHVLGGPDHQAPSDRLNIAAIGSGGKGWGNIRNSTGLDEKTGKAIENMVALCDVDDVRASDAFNAFPKARRFKDFRVMLDKMNKDIDAVIVSTPDHQHAVAAMAAIKMGKDIYCEKPLTHDIYEARMLTGAARKYKVASQMGNQGNSSDDIRKICEWIWAGAIGDVKEVHCWTNRPIWPQGIATPEEKHEVPATLDWDLWLGTAPFREYNSTYCPKSWRGWWEFGTGALGDMACHIIDPAFKALKLGYPVAVSCSVGQVYPGWGTLGVFSDSCPPSSVIHLDFPERGSMPPVTMHWYDGGLKPEKPAALGDEELRANGVIFKGSKGVLVCDVYAANPKLYPVDQYFGYQYPEPYLKRIEQVPGRHQRNWVEACKGGDPASSNFDYAGPLTETVLMGNLAVRCYGLAEGEGRRLSFPGRKKLLWDGEAMRITNYEPANQFVKRTYRVGWSL